MSSPALTIGEFSRMTHLSAKALRFYHREGLLEPAGIDPINGYREYSLEQLPTAQVIRRFRALDMPVDTIRAVLGASDPGERNALIVAHLGRMEEQLASTRAAVESLRSLLEHPSAAGGASAADTAGGHGTTGGASGSGGPGAPGYGGIAIPVKRRSMPASEVLRIDDVIVIADLGRWYTEAFHELDAAVAASGLPVAGPRGGLWSTELFRDERGAVTVFRPVALPPADVTTGVTDVGRVHTGVLPAGEFAVTVHSGPDAEIDRSYGALGAYVARHELSIDGPVRESYLVSEFDTPPSARLSDASAPDRVTEIAWPIFRTAP
jgi:DNA-binding transcriptional MerR regulator/effector-binding domain-containing protein